MSRAPLKLIGLLHRRSDLSLAQFARHWRTVHRDLALRLIAPGIMLGYLQNHRLATGGEIEGLALAGDGFPELWVPDAEALTRIADAPEYRDGAYHDEANFMDGRSQSLVAREHVIHAGSGPVAAFTAVKALLFLRRAPGVSAAQFAAEFVRAPDPLLVPADAKPLRVTRHVAIELPQDTRSECDAIQVYDGVEASYWPDESSFRAAWQRRDALRAGVLPWRAQAGVLVREEPVLIPAHEGSLVEESTVIPATAPGSCRWSCPT